MGADDNTKLAVPVPAAEKEPNSRALLAFVSLIIRVAAAALLACSIARSAWQARGDPWDLAFIAGVGAVLGALFWCIRQAERLAPGAPDAERSRLQVALWFLSTVLSCAFAYRISLMMSTAMVVLIWCMTAFVVLAGFFMLVVCKDHEYQCLDDEVDGGAAGDAKPFSKIRTTDDLV